MSTRSETEAATSLAERVFQHSNEWGKVWFGLLFWGSVLAAGFQSFSPSTAAPVAYGIGGAIGLTVGLVARARGSWV